MANQWKLPTKAEWQLKEPTTIELLPVMELHFEFGFSQSYINKVFKEYEQLTEKSNNPAYNGARVMKNITFWNIINSRLK